MVPILTWSSALCAFVAAYFWFRSAQAQPPAPRTSDRYPALVKTEPMGGRFRSVVRAGSWCVDLVAGQLAPVQVRQVDSVVQLGDFAREHAQGI